MKATLEFTLPDEESEFGHALAGRDALIALENVDNWARGILKHGDPTSEVRRTLEQLRDMVPHELVEKLR